MLIPPTSTGAPSAGAGTAPSLMGEFRVVFNALAARWRWIMLITLASLAAAVLFLMLASPRYVATAQILIDPRAKRIVEGAVVQDGFGSSAAGADTLLVDSQVELIASTAVLKRIVETEKLHLDPEFAISSGGGFRMLLRNTLGHAIFGTAREEAPDTDAVDNALWRFADKHLRVRRVGNTYVINVAVMSTDGKKAARLANAIAASYINDQVRSAGDTTRETTVALQSRIEELRTKLEVAESAVEAFRTKAGLIGSPNLLVTEQQLQQTNDKLILARSQVALAKARYEQVRDVSSRGGAALLGAQSDALKSPVIANLRAALSRVERREAINQQTLRPGHPDYASVLTERRAVLAQIDEELNRIKGNAQAEYDLAASTERALQAELTSLQAQTSSSNQSQVRLRELQREAQSARSIFEQYLNRAKETREQEGLGRGNSRIISQATAPLYPSFPPTMLILAGALFAGLAGGAGATWIAHVLTTPAGGIPVPARETRSPAGRNPGAPARPPAEAGQSSQVDIRAPNRHRQAIEPVTILAAAALAPKTPAPPPVRPPSEAGGLHTLARLPAITPERTLASATTKQQPGDPPPSFADHIAAVDDLSADQYPGYREAIDGLMSSLTADKHPQQPVIALLVGAGHSVGTSSAALSVAYRAAVTGRRTLLVDASASDASLSHVFASRLTQHRRCVLDSEVHLAEITMRDSRTGLSLLPIALAEMTALTTDQQRRLLVGLGRLAQRFDLVVIDAGAARDNADAAFLSPLANKVLVVTDRGLGVAANGASIAATAQRFRGRNATAAIIETAAG